ncbi:MAG: alpha/beta fold hydrolase [Acidimicrobiales bacterium]
MSAITNRTVRANGIDLQIAEAGEGPLVVLCHGFPELSYSWRHQLPALAAAGYHAVAPDQRGYGGSSKPSEVTDYDIIHLTDDVLGLVDALGERDLVVVGHDWGGPVAWMLAQRAPERVRGVMGMSVPFSPRPPVAPTPLFKQLFTDTWFYILYFQEPGVADADLGADAPTTMHRFLSAISGDAAVDAMAGLTGARDGRGMVQRLPEVDALPSWLTQEELDHFSAEFSRTGFTGGLNWYRNLDRNWELTADLEGKGIDVPAAFLAGAKDPVLLMAPPDGMSEWIPDLRGITIVPGAGHWVQQERPAEVNAALLAFLASLA